MRLVLRLVVRLVLRRRTRRLLSARTQRRDTPVPRLATGRAALLPALDRLGPRRRELLPELMRLVDGLQRVIAPERLLIQAEIPFFHYPAAAR